MAEETPGSDTNLGDILAHCELFTSLTHIDCEMIASGCELRSIAAGSLLLAEGDAGEEMYVLVDGVLEVFKQAGGEEVILQRVDEPGAHMGEMALLEFSDQIHRASIRSLCDSHVLVVPQAVFLQALQLSPAIEEQMRVVHHRQNQQLSLVEGSSR